jgi:CRISPR/Cas system endoribonuclease Cas6 (RAMP superfamily)
MPFAAVLTLEALERGHLPAETGRYVAQFWKERLFQGETPLEGGTVHGLAYSPLMMDGQVLEGEIASGTRAWCRVAALSREHAQRLEGHILPKLPRRFALAGMRWALQGTYTDSSEHPWAGRIDYNHLISHHLTNIEAPRGWEIRFAAPTVFQVKDHEVPVPTPERLASFWSRQWQAFGPVVLPKGFRKAVRKKIIVHDNQIQTQLLPHSKAIACLGSLVLGSKDAPVEIRAAFDTLAAFAFFSGSGYHPQQGWGLTQVRSFSQAPPRRSARRNWWLGSPTD